MKRYSLFLLLTISFFAKAQTPPKLVVGIVVDQMRYDYLERYKSKYGKGGFKRLMQQGYNFSRCNINYFPTFTGPGHAAIYSGTTPSINGIVANEWFERSIEDTMYCVSDSTVVGVGTNSSAGKMSPRNLLSTTLSDELKLATNFKGKVVGVCPKDRGGILPAGHHPNACYWYEGKSGNWITSSYYTKSLPGWVSNFNARKYPEQYLAGNWNTLLPIEQYTESSADNVPYEGLLSDKEKLPVFPHELPLIKKDGFGMLLQTPFGNSFTRKFAQEAIQNEGLGQDNITDLLAVSFSSPDYIGHLYGINSIEIEDCYLRLDRELDSFFTYLDKHVGKGNYLVFLTADHGAAHNPQFMNDSGIHAGNFDWKKALDSLSANLEMHMKTKNLIRYYDNQQIYLDDQVVDGKFMNYKGLCDYIASFMTRFPGVDGCITSAQLKNAQLPDGPDAMMQRGYRPDRCGDVFIKLKPGWMELGRKTGTTHGSTFDYDTHIPFLLMGAGIKPGESGQPVSITDIAPTICHILKIQAPSGCTGKAVY